MTKFQIGDRVLFEGKVIGREADGDLYVVPKGCFSPVRAHSSFVTRIEPVVTVKYGVYIDDPCGANTPVQAWAKHKNEKRPLVLVKKTYEDGKLVDVLVMRPEYENSVQEDIGSAW